MKLKYLFSYGMYYKKKFLFMSDFKFSTVEKLIENHNSAINDDRWIGLCNCFIVQIVKKE